MALISIVMLIADKFNDACADSDPFGVTVYLPIFLSVVLGMFLSHDYTYGTIRNKLTVGHTRENIYIANLAVCTLVYLIFYGIYLVLFWGIGIPLLGLSDDFSAKAALTSMILSLLLAAVHSSLVTFICMTVKNNTGTVLSVILNYALMLIVVLGEELSENIAKFVYDFIPLGQAMRLNCREILSRPVLLIFYAMIWIFASALGGIAIFNKTDLK